MTGLRRFTSYLGGMRGRIAGLTVLSYAGVVALFVGLTFVEPLPQQYQPDFGSASWIQLPKPDIAAYFRKTLYIPTPVDQAWIMVAATGSYDLYVNSVHVDNNSYPCARPSGMYDIKSLLLPGKNVIGVHIAGGLSPDLPQLRLRGAYRMVGGPTEGFVSDRSWKAAETPDGVIGSYSWVAANLDDAQWTNAVEAPSAERYSTVQPLTFDPRLFELAPSGDWIVAGGAHATRVSFDYGLQVPSARSAVWLQVAADGGYDLLVNGRLVASLPNNNRATIFGPQMPIQLAGQNSTPAIEMPAVVTPSSGVPGSKDLGVITPNVQGATLQPLSSGPAQNSAAVGKKPAPLLQPTPTPTPVTSQVAPGMNQTANFAAAAAAATPTPLPPLRTTVTVPNPGGGNLQEPVLPTITSSSQPLGVGSASSSNMSGLTMPGLALVTPPGAPSALQPIPLQSSLGAGLNVPIMTAFDLRSFVHGGRNQITVLVNAPAAAAAMVASGFVVAADGSLAQFSSDGNWQAMNHGGGRTHPAESATVIGPNGGAPWGPLPQVAAFTQWSAGADSRAAGRWALTFVITVVIVVLLWWLAGMLLATAEVPAEPLWNCDALLQFKMLIGLLVLLLSTFDARLPYDWCFRPLVIFAIVIGLLASKLALVAVRPRAPSEGPAWRWWAPWAGWRWQLGVLGALMVIGLVIRAWGLFDLSMSHDEVSMVRMSQGVLQTGFPFMRTGSFTRYPATYEVVPYPLAMFSLLLGPGTLAYRMPALIFGTLAIGLIGWVGYRMMSWRVGLVAAFIYCFLPSTVLWSRDAFYCSQESFLALLTIWLFYEAIRDRGVDRKYITYAALAFIVTYFSWEGSGFLLPALFIAILLFKWGEWEWMKDGRLWVCILAIAVIIAIQFSYRQLVLIPEYLGAGKDLNELSTPQLALIDRLVFNPYFYLQQFFFTDNSTVLTILMVVGFFVAWRDRALFYLYVVIAALAFLYTCFLGYYAPRYSYNWLAPLVLAATGTLFYIFDRLALIAAESGFARLVRTGAAAAAVVLLVLSANPFIGKLYRLSATPETPPYNSRLGAHYSPDYRSVDSFVASHLKPGDGVVATSPHVFLYDTGRVPEYSMDTMLAMRMTYDGGQPVPHYIDRSIGVQLITTLGELDRARMQYRRLWLIQRNSSVEYPAVNSYIRAHGCVAYESDEQSVIELDGLPPLEGVAVRD